MNRLNLDYKMNKRKRKLIEIKDVRKIRDELLNCDNIGRQKYLLQSLPTVFTTNVLRIDGEVRKVEIITLDNYLFEHWGNEAFKILCNIAYNKWVTDYLKNK